MSDVARASHARVSPNVLPTDFLRRTAGEFAPRPWIYWADMLASAALGWSLFFFSLELPLFSALQVVATLGAVFALLRAALFIHELCHVKPSQLPCFEVAWNLLVGIPLLIPSLMYVGSHMDHHKRMAFGTETDPEYAPIAHWSRLRIAAFVVTVAFAPLLLPIRWGVLTPLSRAIPALRPWVVGKLSTLVINTSYTRPMPRGAHVRRWNLEEGGAALTVWAVGALVLAGVIPVAFVTHWLVVGAGILVANQVRTLAAHGYENEGECMDAEQQLLDSINLGGKPVLSSLIAPVGLRYHALHHYLPSLPYHSLGTVHRRLSALLPHDAPYRRTQSDGLSVTLQALWKRSAAH
ncbi:MAG: fatty acid desaturase family protein [Myxococcota bacterium]